jgi:hypothetical protein
MTVRVYLQAGRFYDEAPQPGDLLAERLFVQAGEFTETWVETEMTNVPPVGKSVAFSIPLVSGSGLQRVTGTVERRVNKKTRTRLVEV